MVTHDYERGMITGLPRSVVDEVRRTGKLPRGCLTNNYPASVQVWSDTKQYDIVGGRGYSICPEGTDIDYVRSPTTNVWYKLGPFHVTVDSAGEVHGAQCTANPGETCRF